MVWTVIGTGIALAALSVGLFVRLHMDMKCLISKVNKIPTAGSSLNGASPTADRMEGSGR